MILATQFSYAQTISHPSKYLLEENDLGTNWSISVIQIPTIPDELLSDGVKENAIQDILYLSDEGEILLSGAARILEFSTFDKANSYYNVLTSNLGQDFPRPDSSYLNQNANCMLSKVALFGTPEDSFWYLLCLKFPHMIQITLQQNRDLINGESSLSPRANLLIEEVGEKVLVKLPTESKTKIPESKLPEWVRNVFIWYGDGVVSEDEIINTIQFLIKEGIIKI